MFIDYLWGIETSKISPKNESNYKFIDYLWGIETIEVETQPLRPDAGL